MRIRNTLVPVIAAVVVLLASACGGGGGSDAVYSSDDGTGGVRTDYRFDDGADSSGDEEVHLLVQRTNSQVGLSMECYTFYPDGTVELRHSGNRDLSDVGVLSEGEITWDSGRFSSLEWDGEHYRVDGAAGEEIDTCLA